MTQAESNGLELEKMRSDLEDIKRELRELERVQTGIGGPQLQ